MPERISRREALTFFTSSFLAGLISYATLNVESGLKSWQVTDMPTRVLEFNPNLLTQLDVESKELEERIKFDGFDQTLHDFSSATQYQLSPRRDIFAQAMVRVAYLEGGEEEVQQIIKTVKDTGINIEVADLPKKILGVATVRFDDKENPLRITQMNAKINTGSISDVGVYIHELYHLVQYARNPELAKRLTFPKYIADSPLFLAGISAICGSLGGVTVSRRKFLNGTVCGTTSVASMIVSSKLHKSLFPDDFIHDQLNQNLKLFSSHPYLRSLKSSFFDKVSV